MAILGRTRYFALILVAVLIAGFLAWTFMDGSCAVEHLNLDKNGKRIFLDSHHNTGSTDHLNRYNPVFCSISTYWDWVTSPLKWVLKWIKELFTFG